VSARPVPHSRNGHARDVDDLKFVRAIETFQTFYKNAKHENHPANFAHHKSALKPEMDLMAKPRSHAALDRIAHLVDVVHLKEKALKAKVRKFGVQPPHNPHLRPSLVLLEGPQDDRPAAREAHELQTALLNLKKAVHELGARHKQLQTNLIAGWGDWMNRMVDKAQTFGNSIVNAGKTALRGFGFDTLADQIEAKQDRINDTVDNVQEALDPITSEEDAEAAEEADAQERQLADDAAEEAAEP